MAKAEHLGTRIKRALSQNDDLSVAGLAQVADVSVQAVYNKWIKKGQIDKEHLPAVAKYLGTTVEELLTGSALNSREGTNGVREVAQRYGSSGVDVPRLNLSYSMGHGAMPPEHTDVVQMIRVDLPQLRREISFSAPANLRIITGYGDSMAPTFKDGDPLLVDTGVQDIKVDAVYVFALNDEHYIKRLQRRPDGSLLMISDNKNYEPYVINDRAKFRVHGRVLLVWKCARL